MIPVKVLDNPARWSDALRENLLLNLYRRYPDLMAFCRDDHREADPLVIKDITKGLMEGVFTLYETSDGLDFGLSDKGYEEAQKLALIYDL